MPFDYAGAKAAGYSDEEINSYLQGGKQSPPSDAPKQDESFTQTAVNAIPTTLGVLGGLVPGFGPIFGGVGQGLGEVAREAINQNVLNSEPKTGLNLGKTAEQAGEGAVWNLIPGGEGMSLIPRLATRAAGGAIVGGGTQMARNIVERKPITQNVGESAGTTAVANTVIPGLTKTAGKFLGKVSNFVGERVPADILNSIMEKPNELKARLQKELLATMVGHSNVDEFLGRGIISPNQELSTQAIKDALAKTKLAKEALYKKEIAPLLNGVTVNSDEAVSKIRDLINSQRVAGRVNPEIDDVENFLSAQLQKNKIPSDMKIPQQPSSLTLDNEPSMIVGKKSLLGGKISVGGPDVNSPDFEPGSAPKYLKDILPPSVEESPYKTFAPGGAETAPTGDGQKFPKDILDNNVDLTAIDNVRKAFGDQYGKSPLHKQIYGLLADMVANNSSNPEKFAELNGKYSSLIKGENFLNKLNNVDVLPEKLSPQGIDKAIEDARQGQPESLKALLNGLALAGGMTVAAPLHAIGVPGYLVGGFVLRQLFRNILGETFRSPDMQAELAGSLSKLYDQYGGKGDILIKLLNQLGIRNADNLYKGIKDSGDQSGF